MSSLSNAVSIGKRVAAAVSAKNVTFMAAGVAYNAFVSLAPLLLVLLLALSAVGGGLTDRLVAVVRGSLPGPIAEVVAGVLSGGSAAGASVVGLVVLAWGSLKIFRGMDTAFSEIYETDRENSLVDQLVDGVVVGAALLVSIVATVGVSAVFASLADTLPLVGYLTPLVLVAGLVVAFFPIYYRFPDTDLGWREVLPGAVLAAVGWASLQAVFQIYLAFGGDSSESFFGGVVVVVTWLYFSGLVLLLGAVLNAVLAGESTGSPGGVGRGAAEDSSDVELRQTFAREDLSGYLRDLRTRLTGYAEHLEPASEPTEDRHDETGVVESQLIGTIRKIRPADRRAGALEVPAEDVEVVERSREDGDERELTVTFRWRPADGDGTADDEASADERGSTGAADPTDTDESGPGSREEPPRP